LQNRSSLGERKMPRYKKAPCERGIKRYKGGKGRRETHQREETEKKGGGKSYFQKKDPTPPEKGHKNIKKTQREKEDYEWEGD